ncbi:fibronectin type III domain-containing protein [Plantactinospora sp. CA-294935]|uniref:fibronectin type III domain-containing protein n=1 Tax=Plantactinospora sp. CA-294935 TaxID=3240012 RepID=UPI003D8BD85C
MTKLGNSLRLTLTSWRGTRFSRRLRTWVDVRSWRDRGPLRRGRLPLVLLVAAALAAVTAAASGVVAPAPGLQLAQGGHWVASPSLGAVVHVNGSARRVDAQAAVPGIEPGSQVVQGDTSGYVVGRSRIVEFGKSSLSVERTLTPPTGERPVGVEAPGGPYLVYREAGRVVRLGDPPATIPAGGALGEPITTSDGTLWLHRVDSGVLCRLAAGADRISCPAVAPAGHTGALTVVGERPVFVDTTADTLSRVADHGLGRPTPIGVDIPPTARVAPVDVGGRVAILDPAGRRMRMVDASGLETNRSGAAPITVALPDGAYSAPSVTGSSVVLLDLDRNAVLTYNSAGEQQRAIPVPPEAGEPTLSRGEDERVYVDGAEGRHVLVVDPDGAVGLVPVVGDGRRVPSGTPVSPSSVPDPGPRSPTPGPRSPSPGPPTAERPRGDGPASPRRTPPEPRSIPASPPGMPANLRAAAQGGDLRVTWSAAAANGAAVSGYRVTWTPAAGGTARSATRPGSARSMTITGLTRGTAYRITVAAQNSAGRGSPATVRATVPPPPRSVTVSRGSDTTYEDRCEEPDCAYFRIVLRGFSPNTDYHIKPDSSRWPDFNSGATRRTDSRGNLTFEDFPFDSVGSYVWVTVDGVQSNRYLWSAG